MQPAEFPVMLAEILALGMVGDHQVVAGRGGLGREVASAVVATELSQLDDLPPGCLVLFDRTDLAVEEVSADLALRAVHARGLAGLVTQRPPHELPEITRRLADRFDVPLILTEVFDAAAVSAAVNRHLRGPRLVGLRMIDAMLRRLRSAPATADGLISAVNAAVGMPAAVLDAGAELVAGDQRVVDDAVRTALATRLSPRGPVAVVTLFGEDHTLVCHPATVAGGLPANLWLVVRLAVPGRGMIEAVSRVLTMAAWAYTGWIATSSLAGERTARYRALVLADLVEYSDNVSAGMVERATALGWSLSGWHVAIHLNIDLSSGSGYRPVSFVSALEAALAANGIEAGLVQRPGGWACWQTTETRPEPESIAQLARRLGHALRTFGDHHPDVLVAGGVGRPYEGTAGIGESLREAHQASLLATARGGSVVVEDFGSMSVDHLLAGWEGSGPLLRATSSLLAPLREADPAGELVRTLMVYLDHESSATATANVLRVHRNTVLQRVERIRALLPLDLSRPDDRLVAHLAARVVSDQDLVHNHYRGE